MKTVILAGGFGTRLAELTQVIPKPMVEIGGRPILWHIMNIYSRYGFNDFVIALGYKGNIIKNYFLNYYSNNSNLEIDLSSGDVKYFDENKCNWKITLVDTGENSMTGGRLKRLERYLGNRSFMLTYGDAVSDININQLVELHRSHGKIATVTSVHPPARFGELEIGHNNIIKEFKEKPHTKKGWINGGFFIFEPQIFSYINDDSTELEKEPLEKLSKQNELMAFPHDGFWQSMDTLKEKNLLEKIWSSGNPPWFK